jgi:hypothetical protein
VKPINPLLNMYIMVARKDPNGNVCGAWRVQPIAATHSANFSAGV